MAAKLRQNLFNVFSPCNGGNILADCFARVDILPFQGLLKGNTINFFFTYFFQKWWNFFWIVQLADLYGH